MLIMVILVIVLTIIEVLNHVDHITADHGNVFFLSVLNLYPMMPIVVINHCHLCLDYFVINHIHCQTFGMAISSENHRYHLLYAVHLAPM